MGQASVTKLPNPSQTANAITGTNAAGIALCGRQRTAPEAEAFRQQLGPPTGQRLAQVGQHPLAGHTTKLQPADSEVKALTAAVLVMPLGGDAG